MAPIVLFVYNRPWHTEKTLNALSRNILAEQSKLFVFCDGPKQDAGNEDLDKIREVRDLVRSKKWCGEVHIVERDKNLGLAESVIKGVTLVVNEHGKIIVLEDDLLTSPHFLQYMNEALKMYADKKNVFQIAAHQYNLKKRPENVEAFFAPYCTSWGWGTWKRAWDQFNYECKDSDLLETDESLRNSFNLEGAYPFAEMMTMSKKTQKVDSWAIRWWWTVFINKGISLFPVRSLVANIGFDRSGTHSHHLKNEEVENIENIRVRHLPEVVDQNEVLFNEMKGVIRKMLNSNTKEETIWMRITNKFRIRH
ncbi:MAG: glycosyltransferase [Bacteroidia bacterium]|nr:glycosyltransferase [Bacteroidia bacterium]